MTKCDKAERCLNFDPENYSCNVKQDYENYCFENKNEIVEEEDDEENDISTDFG